MAANRNKQSIAVDISTEEGQAIIHQLAARADIIIENYKPDGLVKYGLDHKSLMKAHQASFTALSLASVKRVQTATNPVMI